MTLWWFHAGKSNESWGRLRCWMLQYDNFLAGIHVNGLVSNYFREEILDNCRELLLYLLWWMMENIWSPPRTVSISVAVSLIKEGQWLWRMTHRGRNENPVFSTRHLRHAEVLRGDSSQSDVLFLLSVDVIKRASRDGLLFAKKKTGLPRSGNWTLFDIICLRYVWIVSVM